MIQIYTTPLSYRIKVLPDSQLVGTQIYLSKYLKRFSQMTWSHIMKRMILYKRYVYYNKKTNMLCLPRYDLPHFCQMLKYSNIPYEIKDLPLQKGKDVDISLKSFVKDRNADQTSAIEFLTNSKEHVRGLSLSPGMGKTYCAIKTICNLKKRAMISVAGLVDQWVQAILNFTTLTEDDIYVVKGAPSLTKLISQIDRNIFPKIIVCSLQTMRNYASDDEAYENYPDFDTLIDILKVGVRVIDEAHLNFHLSMMLDLRSNANINIALTATFDRSDYTVKQIFHSHYPAHIRHGEQIFDKYVDIYGYNYSLGGMLPQKAYTTPNGYNHSKYEMYLLGKGVVRLEYIYAHVYSPAIYAYYVNEYQDKDKLLILCSTVDMCKWFEKRLKDDLPSQLNLKIGIYISESDMDVLSDLDVIISTPGSAGTGTDIKDLKVMLMTVATGSDVLNKQSLGRLRKLDSLATPIYIYTWNRDIASHIKYNEIRKITFMARGKKFEEITV